MKYKTNNLLVILFSFLFVTACAPTEMDIRVAKYVCHDKGGLYELFGLDNLYIRCNDNTVHERLNVVIPLEYINKEK
jgi:hypothetical protein